MNLQTGTRFKNVFMAVLAAFLLFAAMPAYAGGAEEPLVPCDPEYMDALERRAWLEAQREISQNQNIIVKPDSVLEYTCFIESMSVLARTDANGAVFSELACCGAEPMMGALNDVLNETVMEAVVPYLEENFGHVFLGGRATDPDPGLDYDLAENGRDEVNHANYECNMMQEIWDMTRCMNFNEIGEGEEEGREEFWDFMHYTENDPRQFPFSTCEPAISEEDLQVAFNERQENYVLAEENEGGLPPYLEDETATQYERILPATLAGGCSEPVATGICVDLSDDDGKYADAVCTNPGCHYVRPGGGPAACGADALDNIGTCAQ